MVPDEADVRSCGGRRHRRCQCRPPANGHPSLESGATPPVIHGARLDRRAIARYGINAAGPLDGLRALGGRERVVVLEGKRRFALQVRYAAEDREDPERIGALWVRAPSGQLLPLFQVADVRMEDGPAQIRHEAGRRQIRVEMNVRGRDLAGFVADARACPPDRNRTRARDC
jgi:heavy metal efflux system protein